MRVNRRVATVGCNSTGEEWRLTCDGRQWSGSTPNCTEHVGKLGTHFRKFLLSENIRMISPLRKVFGKKANSENIILRKNFGENLGKYSGKR